jgi:hypothetical protein
LSDLRVGVLVRRAAVSLKKITRIVAFHPKFEAAP